jgi:hypothetical protein
VGVVPHALAAWTLEPHADEASTATAAATPSAKQCFTAHIVAPLISRRKRS